MFIYFFLRKSSQNISRRGSDKCVIYQKVRSVSQNIAISGMSFNIFTIE